MDSKEVLCELHTSASEHFHWAEQQGLECFVGILRHNLGEVVTVPSQPFAPNDIF
jgi:hypothetical protein